MKLPDLGALALITVMYVCFELLFDDGLKEFDGWTEREWSWSAPSNQPDDIPVKRKRQTQTAAESIRDGYGDNCDLYLNKDRRLRILHREQATNGFAGAASITGENIN